MSYFNRPLLVRNALNSILRANEHHGDWELYFGDDSSIIPGKPIVEEVLKDHLDKVTFANSNMTLDDKIANGLVLGRYCNEGIRNSDADIGIMFSDDDELHPHYLANLADYFTNNQDVLYCWSAICPFNPILGSREDLEEQLKSYNGMLRNRYNNHGTEINPVNNVDASQVAWRLSCCKDHGAWFADTTKFVDGKPWTKDTDKGFFESLYEKCGPCRRTPYFAQYKGVHDYQLLWHKNVGEAGLRAYHQMVLENAGVKF